MTGTRRAVTLFSWFGAVISLLVSGCDRARPSISSPTTSLVSAEATSEQVHELCGACHRFPPPDSFPRSAWKGQVQQAYEFLKYPPRNNPAVLQQLVIPPKDQVLRYFERRAPKALPVL